MTRTTERGATKLRCLRCLGNSTVAGSSNVKSNQANASVPSHRHFKFECFRADDAICLGNLDWASIAIDRVRLIE